LEIGNVPPEHVAEFCGSKKFKFFNTNNIWINLVRLKQILKDGSLDLDLIIGRKQVGKQSVLQLETAVGSALNLFPDAIGMSVPRSRFLPVKKTSDLLLVQSDLFSLDRGTLKRDLTVGEFDLPRINLKEPFNDLKEYQQRIPVPPDITELNSLELQGHVRFNGKVTLKGDVRLVSNKKTIRIPKGAVLENKIVES
jgi:UTP--glucose-1-phosphate uridylyltransferase